MKTNETKLILIDVQELSSIIENKIDKKLDGFLKSQQKKDEPKLLTPAEVCKLLQISQQTLILWHRSGKLLRHRIEGSRRVYYNEVDIYSFMKVVD